MRAILVNESAVSATWRFAKYGLAFAGMLTLAACATPTPEQRASGEPFDPYEGENRKTHQFNLNVDRYLFRPSSVGYVTIIPKPIRTGASNFSVNLLNPGHFANYVAQAKGQKSAETLSRFFVNSTVGILGIFDVASAMGIPEVDTDFGQTLHVWGVEEGAYIELPFFGPSTQRDAVGTLADFFTNPLTFAPTLPLDNVGFYAKLLEQLGDRGEFVDTVDSILYESADSYAQSRIIYLQNRRFELAQDSAGDEFDPYIDPYADIYGDSSADPYSDPYEDPYAQ